MRIEIYFAVDGNENVGVGLSAEDAMGNIDCGRGPDVGAPIALATIAVEINAPKLIEGPLVVVPDAKVQTIQPEIVGA